MDVSMVDYKLVKARNVCIQPVQEPMGSWPVLLRKF